MSEVNFKVKLSKIAFFLFMKKKNMNIIEAMDKQLSKWRNSFSLKHFYDFFYAHESWLLN